MKRRNPSVPLLSTLVLIAACEPPAEKKNAPAPEVTPTPSPSAQGVPKIPDKAETRVETPQPIEYAPSSPSFAHTPPADGPRVYAKSRHVWVRSMPQSDVQWIGYLWWGGSVKVRGDQRVAGAGCSKQWVPVEPRGWVCVDEKQATLDPSDEELVSIFPYRGNVGSPWPHKYAAVHAPARVYKELPDEPTQRVRERGYERHIAAVRKARETGTTDHFPKLLGKLDPGLSGKKPPTLGPLPRGLSEGRTRIASRSAISYSTEADFEDRTFLLTSDLGWVPKDRVEILKPAQFVGVELKDGIELPVAFFRGRSRPAFKKNGKGGFEPIPDQFARHAYVQLENDFVRDGRTRYYRVKGEDLWVSSKEAVIPTPREKTPWGAPVGQPDTTGNARKGRATWLQASILGGWLVAFEGTKAVYATMISAGRGGKPHPEKDPLETASTPTGWFPIGGKFRTATMESSSTPIVHSEVPWTQNFSGPHAIHSAYWHEDWGNLKSAGCVNVSPRDGKWLFEFTEPEVPEGWHGVRYVSRYGGGSTLFIVGQ